MKEVKSGNEGVMVQDTKEFIFGPPFFASYFRIVKGLINEICRR